MKIGPPRSLGLLGCIGALVLLALGVVSMVRFATHVDTVEDAPGLLCAALAEDRFAVVSVVTNASFIHFNDRTRVVFDMRSGEHFTHIELGRARFDKPRVVGRTECLTIVTLGDIVFLVSKDNKIQSIVRRKRFGEIKDHLIQEISDELTRRASKDGVSTPLESTRSSPARVRSKQPMHLVRPMANRTSSGHRDIPTPTAGPR